MMPDMPGSAQNLRDYLTLVVVLVRDNTPLTSLMLVEVQLSSCCDGLSFNISGGDLKTFPTVLLPAEGIFSYFSRACAFQDRFGFVA